MALIKCIICSSQFESERASKLCCSSECEKIRKSNYDSERYLEFRNADRKKRRQMLAEKYSIISTNLYKIQAVCDECLTTFYYDYSIYQSFNNTFVSSFNTTEWGAPCCPHCGLVEKSKYDDDSAKYLPVMTLRDQKLFLSQLRRCKKPILKHQAIYIKNNIDFITEAEDVRKKLSRIYPDTKKLTQEEIDICITALFRSLK